MKAINFDGVFWLAGDLDNTATGKFLYRNRKGAELDIVGTFHSNPIHLPSKEIFTIHGVGAKSKWTIFQAQSSGRQITVPGFSREKYHSPLVMNGKGFLEEKHLLQLTSVHLQMQYLLDWVNQTGLSYGLNSTIGKADSLMRAEDFRQTIIFTPPSTITHSTKEGTVEISFPFTSSSSGIVLAECQIKQLCSIGFKWKSPTSIDEVLKVAHSLQDLLALSIGTPPLIESASVTCFEHEREFELLTSDLGNSMYDDSKSHIGDWIFSLDMFGGIEGVANWLNISQKYRIAINSLLSVKYTPNLYMENKLINIMIATEAFERARCNKRGKLKLEYVLDNLVQYAGDLFVDLVGDTQTWIKKAIKMRNEIVHRQSMKQIEILWLDFITDSSYWLIIICLLRECHINDTVLQQISSISDFKRIKNFFSSL